MLEFSLLHIETYYETQNCTFIPQSIFFITIKTTIKEKLSTLLCTIRNGRELKVIVLSLRMVKVIALSVLGVSRKI